MSMTHHPTPMAAALNKLTLWLTNEQKVSDYLHPIVSIFRPEAHTSLIPAKVVSLVWQNSKIYTLTLKPKRKQFRGFTAGQYVHLETSINGQRLLRTFSISSAPETFERHGIIQLSIREQITGKVTPWLCRYAEVDSYLHISQAQGEFIPRNTTKPSLYIAAGSGITPILSMLLQASEAEPKRDLTQCHLFYFVSDANDLGFQEDLERIRASKLNIHIFSTQDSGHFSKTHLRNLPLSPEQYEAYICGPGNMIESTQSILKEAGLDERSQHFEYFGLPHRHAQSDTQDDESNREKSITFHHSKRHVRQPKNDQRTLLEIAEDAALSPLSGCRIGVCHQCACKKTSGRIRNIRTNTVSDSGMEEIQLCISTPIDDVALEL